MDREKFRQKALKQTKQKKSKWAEFLMVKEDREATEGIGNPAFNVSSPDLLAHQTSDRKVIRRDTLDPTLAAHQQKFRLLASAEPKGNEYSRNYFDPLMDEEINPRQCGMEVSREAPLQVDTRILNDRLMKLFEERGQGEAQDGSRQEEILDSEETVNSRKRPESHKEGSEASEGYVQKNTILLGSSSLEQDLKCGGEGLSQYIPMSCLNTNKTFDKVPSQPLIAHRDVWKENRPAELCTLTDVTHESKAAAAGPCWKVERGQAPQHLQVRMKCARGLKNKAPRGSYRLRVSLLGRPGGCVFQWQQTEQLKTRTHPVRHDGNFYDLGLYFHESLYVDSFGVREDYKDEWQASKMMMVTTDRNSYTIEAAAQAKGTGSSALPPKKDVKPGMAFLFELCLLRGKYASFDWVVGWAAFPVCDNNFDVVDGKFKCPLLRGHYDQKFDSFRKMEDLMCQDLDHWLCNLYFQVIKLPLCLDDQTTYERQTQLPPEFPVSLMAGAETAESGVENTAGLSEKQTEENICSSLDGKAKILPTLFSGLVDNNAIVNMLGVIRGGWNGGKKQDEQGTLSAESFIVVVVVVTLVCLRRVMVLEQQFSTGDVLLPRRHLATPGDIFGCSKWGRDGGVEGSISNKFGPCPMDCDLNLLKEDRELHKKTLSFDETIPSLFIWPDGSAPWSRAQRPRKEFGGEKAAAKWSLIVLEPPSKYRQGLGGKPSLAQLEIGVHPMFSRSILYVTVTLLTLEFVPGFYLSFHRYVSSNRMKLLWPLAAHPVSDRGFACMNRGVVAGLNVILHMLTTDSARSSGLDDGLHLHGKIQTRTTKERSMSNSVPPSSGADQKAKVLELKLYHQPPPPTPDPGKLHSAFYLCEFDYSSSHTCSSVADGTGSREFFKHLHFGMVSAFSELQFAEWRSQGFWYIILLMASLWFLRLYLHYLSQWLFLQAISIPVTKFHFSPFTVELCYPSSSLAIKEELLVVVVGPLMLNAVILPLVLIRWGCQLLFASCPDVLSKLIITMGLWTVLDPLAVFIVDTILGRLTQNGETPVADAAKLYWVFVRTMQSGILGVMLTVLIYILLFIISSLILYLYCLRSFRVGHSPTYSILP
ncbi:uncharacterized protein LOC121020450 [Herpailurus yagouaroundi]|uniref:uncharacterized protein LOC121020450 n=1 Tax=Herpailurus yagouaroundi TaxID=1608482 RepID=UPI001AD707EC|nr:uncharacterized protein LOC121020450 [Puma yagouaroundi]